MTHLLKRAGWADFTSKPVAGRTQENQIRLSCPFVLQSNRKRKKGVADAFAAATAEKLGAVLVTGDPELTALQGVLAIEALERKGGT
ncbi:MAG: hypothetical protein N2117_09820 [Anaerolineales bacterium]|nr:hypothetical protein [Anaerolineales bacterium]